MRDLESRKRAPLYQKKQEEELRVANEKAAEAEARAQEAESKAKELKVCCRDEGLPHTHDSVCLSAATNFAYLCLSQMQAAADVAEKLTAELSAQLDKVQKQSAEALATLAEQHSLELQKAVHERSLLQVGCGWGPAAHEHTSEARAAAQQ